MARERETEAGHQVTGHPRPLLVAVLGQLGPDMHSAHSLLGTQAVLGMAVGSSQM